MHRKNHCSALLLTSKIQLFKILWLKKPVGLYIFLKKLEKLVLRKKRPGKQTLVYYHLLGRR